MEKKLVEFDKDQVVQLLMLVEKEFHTTTMRAKWKALWSMWVWNPFSGNKGDFNTTWNTFRKNLDYLEEFLETIIYGVQRACDLLYPDEEGMGGLKLYTAVKYLDKVIKLPYWLELIDGPVFMIIFSYLLKKMKKQYGEDWVEKRFIPIQLTETSQGLLSSEKLRAAADPNCKKCFGLGYRFKIPTKEVYYPCKCVTPELEKQTMELLGKIEAQEIDEKIGAVRKFLRRIFGK